MAEPSYEELKEQVVKLQSQLKAFNLMVEHQIAVDFFKGWVSGGGNRKDSKVVLMAEFESPHDAVAHVIYDVAEKRNVASASVVMPAFNEESRV